MLHATWRIARAGVVAALIVAAGGWMLGRARFGASDEEAVRRVQTDIVAEFASSADTLGRIAARLAAARQPLASAQRGQASARALFDEVDAALSDQETGRTGVTVYDILGAPLAWGGRASDLPKPRIDGPATVFVAPGALGPRLVRVEPVMDRRRGSPTRIATIVVEQQLGPVRSTRGAADTFVMATRLAPVSLRVRVGDVSPPLSRSAYSFVIPSPSGGPLVDADVSPVALEDARQRWQTRARAVTLSVLGLTLMLCAAASIDVRARSTDTRTFVAASFLAFVFITAVRFAASVALGSAAIGPFLNAPIDLLVTALTLSAGVWLSIDTIERWRLAGPRPRLLIGAVESSVWIGLAYTAAGMMAAVIVWMYGRFLQAVVSNATFDLLQFSLHPLTMARVALASALVLLHASIVWSAVAVTRLPSVWRTRSAFSRQVGGPAAWLLGVTIALAVVRDRDPDVQVAPLLVALMAAGLAAVILPRWRQRTRHASQASQLGAVFLALLVPAAGMYPSLLGFNIATKERLIAERYGPTAIRQRQDLKDALAVALDQIDRNPALGDLVIGTADTAAAAGDRSYRAFLVWSGTELDTYRLTSAVELYGADGRLVSRFALSLPEYTTTPHRAASCRWDVVDEVSPFGSTQRHVLRASRGICERGTVTGSVVVSVMLDPGTLPFTELQSPYLTSLQTGDEAPPEGVFGRDVEFVAYGWSQVPTFSSTTRVWPLSDAVFQRMVESRDPFWTTVERDGVTYRVYFMSDQGGIYALGYPVVTARQHLVNIAELIFLVGVVYVVLLMGATLITAITSRTPATGRALLREVRASFYRKLFLAFVAAAVVPVVILAYATHSYFVIELNAGVQEAAAKTATVAQRLVDDYATLQQRGTSALAVLDDQIMVLVRRAIDQDVNLYEGSQLQATSERDLFASGLLPTRTPGDVYRRIVLDRLPTYVGEEEVGDSPPFLLAAAPVRAGVREGIVTVPVTNRRQEIERQIDDLDRQVLSAAVFFSLLGAALGYWMAERIADPISRLTRATRRIARGNFDARVSAVASDELGRLIGDFNTMAEDLKQQRRELERTQRLEAWADMARQVAHDIKNPLTPIQLSAEHAQRINLDRGRPLSPVLDDCIAAILSQVRLLRQIAAEFSSFAATVTPHPAPTRLPELIEEVVGPYRTGLSGRIDLEVDVPTDLPTVVLDRTLMMRALANIIENALHAMPGGGTLRVAASLQPPHAVVEVSDTGSGMDPDSMARIFEPYFSTRTGGTGLGLTIAKRNVELNGGTISIRSEKGVGTTVTITIPT